MCVCVCVLWCMHPAAPTLLPSPPSSPLLLTPLLHSNPPSLLHPPPPSSLPLLTATQDDIEYAYAYEGIVVPGGKIMMGRWWRCAEAGFGEGRELVEGGGEDRGPWLFWADD